ncbi:MAG: hypothetical protein BM557_01150 [Flavobacterium sp. MedPE-SWcel]|mgnify:CR=1 FL=1|uniref:hypothetical protein n=1 Tax=uncultured Flavobacterium sp. TaxID=165435 RepID=UPI0009240BFB|nr:hypothetical protein [uncultured Flavobacterium sp.]OIQ22014.1 MAG: hypothetical protein BM557_01150 [Flavobacterium sp. MedPE-SWcel]
MKDFRKQEEEAWKAVKEHYPNDWQKMVANARGEIKRTIRIKKYDETPEHTRKAVREITHNESILNIKPLALLAAAHVVNLEKDLQQRGQEYNDRVFRINRELNKLETIDWDESLKIILRAFYKGRIEKINRYSETILNEILEIRLPLCEVVKNKSKPYINRSFKA